jgi:hypothetical protein
MTKNAAVYNTFDLIVKFTGTAVLQSQNRKKPHEFDGAPTLALKKASTFALYLFLIF